MGRSRRLLTVEQILGWADEHQARTGSWPKIETRDGGSLPLGEKWRNLDRALREGTRGLAGGSSLPRLLDRERGVRNPKGLRLLTEELIVRWARAHYRCSGEWPDLNAGPVGRTNGEQWKNIDAALRQGSRGLPGGDSLGKLLARRMGVRTRAATPRLTVEMILRWADAHRAVRGRWPGVHCGPVLSAPGETWVAVNDALWRGTRGLPGGDSLFRLLVRHGRRDRRQQNTGREGPERRHPAAG
jgi:hypothetical protein